MSKQVQFVEDKNYMSGFNILSDRRSLIQEYTHEHVDIVPNY